MGERDGVQIGDGAQPDDQTRRAKAARRAPDGPERSGLRFGARQRATDNAGPGIVVCSGSSCGSARRNEHGSTRKRWIGEIRRVLRTRVESGGDGRPHGSSAQKI